MDKDLIAYLDERFRESGQQLTSVRKEINGRFEEINGRFEGTDRHFEEINGRFDRTDRCFEEINDRFDGINGSIDRVEEGVRHTQIMVEGLRGDVQLLAEKMGTFDEKLIAHRSELRKEIGEVKTLLHLSYGDLNRRIG
jgi:predicted nuclease with TOPRIM domain